MVTLGRLQVNRRCLHAVDQYTRRLVAEMNGHTSIDVRTASFSIWQTDKVSLSFPLLDSTSTKESGTSFSSQTAASVCLTFFRRWKYSKVLERSISSDGGSGEDNANFVSNKYSVPELVDRHSWFGLRLEDDVEIVIVGGEELSDCG